MSAKSTSLWYPRYVGDYQRKTSHLSLTEHGVYSVFLDHYYSTGLPLPANADVLQRICRAFAAQEVDAMHSVLRQFFILKDDGYHNEKADEELLKRCDISEKRRKAADVKHANASARATANASANADTSTSTSTLEEEEIIHVDLADLIAPANWGKINGSTTQEVADAVFAEHFWPAYPKIKCSKQDAKLAFRRALKSATASEILVGVNRYLEKWEDLPDDRKPFAKHAATWLNKKMWIDELEEIDNGG